MQEEGFLQSQASAITLSSKLWKGWFLFSPFVDVTTRNLRTVLPTLEFDSDVTLKIRKVTQEVFLKTNILKVSN